MARLAFVVIIVAGLATGNFLASIFEFHGNTEMWFELGWFVLTLFGAALVGKWVALRTTYWSGSTREEAQRMIEAARIAAGPAQEHTWAERKKSRLGYMRALRYILMALSIIELRDRTKRP